MRDPRLRSNGEALGNGGPTLPKSQIRTRTAFVIACGAMLVSCATPPPQDPDDLCSIFEQRRSWYRATQRTRERWGISEGVQLALIHQESRFRANARPPRRKILWILPGPRPTSAYGYGQVLDSTWKIYLRKTENRGADRDDFADVTDFIGWYANHIARRTGIPRNDARLLYLAYHEGPGGFERGSHLRKDWLLQVSRKVERRARRYETQFESCRESLEKPRGWWH